MGYITQARGGSIGQKSKTINRNSKVNTINKEPAIPPKYGNGVYKFAMEPLCKECLTKVSESCINWPFTMSVKSLLSFVLGTFAVMCAADAAPQPTPAPRSTPEYINYTTITGFFLQDEPTTNVSTFDYVRLALTRRPP